MVPAESVTPGGKDKGASGLLLAASFFVVLAVVLPLLVFEPSRRPSLLNTALAETVCVISSLRLSHLVWHGRPHLLTMGFHVYSYVVLGLAVLAQTSFRQYPTLNISYSDALVTQGLFVVLTGLIAFEAGTLLHRRRFRSERLLTRLEFSHLRAVVVGLIGLFFVALSVSKAGVAPYFTSREGASAALAGRADGFQVYALPNKAALLLRAYASQVPTFLAFIALLSLRKRRKDRVNPITYYSTIAMLLVLGAANLLVNNPISNSRFWFLTVLLGVVCIYFPWQAPWGMRLLVLGATSGLLFVFTSLDAFRRSQVELQYVGFRQSLRVDEAFSGFETILKGLLWVAGNGHTHGSQSVGAWFSFVPSRVWPGKPGDTGHLIDPLFNRTATLWTEAHIEFGLPCVIVVFLLLGFICRATETSLSAGSPAVATLLPILCGFMFMLCRGSLVNAVGAFYPLGLVALVLLVPNKGAHDPQRSADRRHLVRPA